MLITHMLMLIMLIVMIMSAMLMLIILIMLIISAVMMVIIHMLNQLDVEDDVDQTQGGTAEVTAGLRDNFSQFLQRRRAPIFLLQL